MDNTHQEPVGVWYGAKLTNNTKMLITFFVLFFCSSPANLCLELRFYLSSFIL